MNDSWIGFLMFAFRLAFLLGVVMLMATRWFTGPSPAITNRPW